MSGAATQNSLDQWTSLEHLLEYLGTGPSTFEAAHAMLLFTVGHREQLGRARENSLPGRRSRLREELLSLFSDGHYLLKFNADLMPRVRDLRDSFSDLDDVLVADALAMALGDACGTTFIRQAESYYLLKDDTGRRGNSHGEAIGRPLVPRDPVPISSPLVDRLEDSRRTTDPYNLPAGQRGMRLRNLALAPPEVAELRVEFDFSICDALQTMLDLNDGLTFALCLPTSSLADDCVYDQDTVRERFFDVRPTSVDHTEKLLECLDLAHGAGADLVLFPELSVPTEARDRMVEKWASQTNAAAVAVLGSSHHIDGQQRRANTAWMAASVRLLHDDTHTSTRTVLPVHHKTVPFIDRKIGKDNKKLHFSEDLTHRAQPRLRVFAGKTSMLLAVTICIDFLDSRVRDILRDLFVDVVLVPAMTEKTQVFRDLITGLVGETQAHVLLANAVVSKEGVHGLVGHPHGPERVTDIDASWKEQYVEGGGTAPGDGPGVALIHLPGKNEEGWSRWVALGTRSG